MHGDPVADWIVPAIGAGVNVPEAQVDGAYEPVERKHVVGHILEIVRYCQFCFSGDLRARFNKDLRTLNLKFSTGEKCAYGVCEKPSGWKKYLRETSPTRSILESFINGESRFFSEGGLFLII